MTRIAAPPAAPSSVAPATDARASAPARAGAAAAAAWRDRALPALRAAGRPLRVVTPLGWGALGVGAAAALVGAWFGWVELLALAAVPFAALLVSIIFVLGRTQYGVDVGLASNRVVVGERAVGEVTVRNAARRPSRPSTVEFRVGAGRAQFRVPRLAPDAVHDELFTIPTQRRAVLPLGPVTSVRSDPLGLLRREVRWTEPDELFVHPRTAHLDGDTTGYLRDLEGLPTRDLSSDDVSFHALREYVPGDDLRYVHWKSTARTGQVMIRQFEETRRSHLVVALSTRLDDYAGEDEFELAVSLAATLGAQALRAGRTLTALTGAGVLPAPTATQLLDRYSAVEASDAAPGADEAARLVTRIAPGASVVAFVNGSRADATSLRAASLRVPVTARTFALRADVGGALARRSLGELVVVAVPELPAMRAAMRAVNG